jgi:S1-C subfamily serine protease
MTTPARTAGPMPLTLPPARQAVPYTRRVTRAVVLLVALALGAVLGWQLGEIGHPGHTAAPLVATPAAATTSGQAASHHGHPTRPGHPGHPALATATGDHSATVPAAGHAALVTLTPTTGVAGLAHLDRPLPPAHIQRLAVRTAPGIVTLTTDLGGGRGEAGTGIVLTSSGDILTNAHVIAGYRHTPNGDTVRAVDLGDGHTYPVTVLGADPDRDIALVHLDGAHDLPVARLGDSRDLRPGEQLASLGDAYGRGELAIGAGPLVATGQAIPSTTGRARRLTGLLRVHTGIVPGQSGGPLVDRHGRVVGMNVAYLAGADHTPSGDGYAIPLWRALHTARTLARAAGHTHPRAHTRRGLTRTGYHHRASHLARRHLAQPGRDRSSDPD